MKIIPLETRLLELEKTLPNPQIAETILSRCLLPNGLGWCLAIGIISMPKVFWYGKTINEVVSLAEKELK